MLKQIGNSDLYRRNDGVYRRVGENEFKAITLWNEKPTYQIPAGQKPPIAI